MMKLPSGMIEAIIGIIGGILFSAILTSFKENNLISSNMVIWFTIAGFAGSIAMLFTIWKAGVIFTIGWIIGALLLKDVLSTGDFIIYIVAPMATLIIRVIVLIKIQTSGK
jgi:hypothetical protein